jgi:hypothetical protein
LLLRDGEQRGQVQETPEVIENVFFYPCLQ